jgi:energy-coupling factor transport system permease protein
MTTNTFIAGNGFLYRFDPRAKILSLILFCIWFFLPVTLTGLYVTVGAIILVGTLSTNLGWCWRTCKSILPMLVFMILFIPFNIRSGEPIATIGGWTVATREGVLQVARLVGRFVGITYVAMLLFSTTRMNEVMLSLRWYRMPYKVSLVIALAFTYIPFIADSFGQIADSHRLREAGEGEETRSVFSRLSNLVPTLTSALVVALRSVPYLAMSLEQRGLGRAGRRTSFHTLDSYRHAFTHFLLSGIIPAVLWFVFRV